MAGTKAGGDRAAATNKARYGTDFYRRIGAKSNVSWTINGRKPRGFSTSHELAVRAGSLGGIMSKRSKRSLT